MAKQRILNTKFWSDPFVQELSASEKLLYVYLLTNEHTTVAGVYEITERTISFDTGLTLAQIKKGMDTLLIHNKVLFFEGWIVIKNFLRHQNLKSIKIKTGVVKILESLPERVLGMVSYDMDTLYISFDKSESESELKPKSKPEEKNIKKETPTKEEFLDFGKKLCEETKKDYEGMEFSLGAKFDSWEESKWKDGNGNAIKNWKTKLRNTFPYLKATSQSNFADTDAARRKKAWEYERKALGLPEKTT